MFVQLLGLTRESTLRYWIVTLALIGCVEGTLTAPGIIVIDIPEAGFNPATDAGTDSQSFVPDQSSDSSRPTSDVPSNPGTDMMDMSTEDVRIPPSEDMANPPDPDQGPAPATCEAGTWTLSALGQNRTVRFSVPAAPQQNAPRVLLLHGNGDTASNFCTSTNLCSFLAGRGALVATPNGRQRNLTVGGQQANLCWNAYDTSNSNEDVVLVDAIIAEIDRRCGAGPLYVWGHSQGGYFGYLVAMERDTHGAMIGAAADPMPGTPWRPTRTFPAAFLIGTLDYGIDGARASAQRLESSGHTVLKKEIEGARHGGYLMGHDSELANFLGL
jgi:pimeloyl-ACP methyl ester carboxylesterase